MKKFRDFIVSRLVAGVLVLAPIYLAVLLLLKAMKSLTGLVRPLAKLLPEWLPADRVFSLLLVMIISFLIGTAVRTRRGRAAWNGWRTLYSKKSLATRLFEVLLSNWLARHKANRGSRRWPRLKRLLSPRSLLKNLRTGFSRFSSLPYPRLSVELSIFSARIVCIE